MEMPKITKRTVDATAPQKVRVYLWHDEIKGFGLQVLPSGVRSFVYQYRSPEGKTRRATIGRVSGITTAEQARKRTKRLRRIVETGGDPLADTQAAREALTVAQMLDQWIESARFKERPEATQTNDKERVERHAKPTLGKKYVNKRLFQTLERMEN
jgi:hypothetical protein